MFAGIFIGVLIVLLLMSILISYHYHNLAKGLLIYNTKLKKDFDKSEKDRNDYAIKYYWQVGKTKRLYNILKNARLSLVLESKTCKQLQKANEEIYGDRYHAGFKMGYAHAVDRINKNDLSTLALGEKGFVKEINE